MRFTTLPTQIRLVSWDVNGTIFDTTAYNRRLILETMAAAGVPCSAEQADTTRGMSLYGCFDALRGAHVTRGRCLDLHASLEREYLAEMQKTGDADVFGLRIFPDFLPTLEVLEEKRIEHALFTNLQRAMLMVLLESFGLRDRFAPDLILTIEDVRHRKPDPDGLESIRERRNLRCNEVVHLGDTMVDIRTAWNAGVHAAYISRDAASPAELDEGTVLFLSDLRELAL